MRGVWLILNLSLLCCAADGSSAPMVDGGSSDADSDALYALEAADVVTVPAPEISVQTDACATPLVPLALEHSCFHFTNDTHTPISASSEQAAAPDISALHGILVLSLPAYEGGGYGGYVRYQHIKTSVYPAYAAPLFVMFSDTPDAVLQVFAAGQSGNAQAALASYHGAATPSDQACLLNTSWVYALPTSQDRYFFIYAPGSAQVQITVEYLFDYVYGSWLANCAG